MVEVLYNENADDRYVSIDGVFFRKKDKVKCISFDGLREIENMTVTVVYEEFLIATKEERDFTISYDDYIVLKFIPNKST